MVSSARRMREGGEDPAFVDRMLREVVAGAPRRGAALVRLGRALLLELEFRAAEDAFRRGRLEKPVLGARGLAMALVAQGRLEEARPVLAELERLPPSPLRDVSLAHVYSRVGRDGEAARLFEQTQGAQLPPDEEGMRVSVLLRRGQLQPALEIARQHRARFPERPQAHLLLARVLAAVAADLERRGRAAESLERRLELEALLAQALERGAREVARIPLQRLLEQVRGRLR